MAREEGAIDPEDIWGRIKPGDVLKRQGELQREVNSNTRGIGARRAEIKRAMEFETARWESFMQHEFADHEKRIAALELAGNFWQDDDNVQAEIKRLGLVRLTDGERAVFSQDIANKVFAHQSEARKGERTRFFDGRVARVGVAAAIVYGGYQMIFGGVPIATLVKGALHIP